MYKTQIYTLCKQMHSVPVALTFYGGYYQGKSTPKLRNTDRVYDGDLTYSQWLEAGQHDLEKSPLKDLRTFLRVRQ